MSVSLHLTPRTSVRPRNDTLYPTGDEELEVVPSRIVRLEGLVRWMLSTIFQPKTTAKQNLSL
ncbi:hypothetical protein GBAR_LOCUS27736 [Geodia barretti]|uniref:Uncharacterized protein n=1 Tax=Geodia barretti TaxID=519541 RepID=A0AA35TM43_GEOBA|nr:hypothetical protein GBAR_LOCUS27736 [Geodia barretti]